MYVAPDLPTRKALISAVAAKLKIRVYSPGPSPAKTDGIEYVEGPHYPRPHRWYARVEVKDGCVVKVFK